VLKGTALMPSSQTAVTGRFCAVVVATCYDLEDVGIEFLQGEIFLTLADGAWPPPNLLYNG